MSSSKTIPSRPATTRTVRSSTYTEGVLCRDPDKSPTTRKLVFFPGLTADDVEIYLGKYWVRKPEALTRLPFTMWTPSEWDRTYPARDKPKKGECVEIFLEL